MPLDWKLKFTCLTSSRWGRRRRKSWWSLRQAYEFCWCHKNIFWKNLLLVHPYAGSSMAYKAILEAEIQSQVWYCLVAWASPGHKTPGVLKYEPVWFSPCLNPFWGYMIHLDGRIFGVVVQKKSAFLYLLECLGKSLNEPTWSLVQTLAA